MNVRDKVAKLLALADSPNEHEAKAALLKARELMAQHKLQPEDVRQTEATKVINRTVGISCTKLTNPWAVTLSGIVAENYCCKAFLTRKRGGKTVKVAFAGLEDDFDVCVRIFLYAYEFVMKRIAEIREEGKEIYLASTLRKMGNAYGDGFCRGLSHSFREQQEQRKQEWGLVMVTPQKVLDFMEPMGKPKVFEGRNDLVGSLKEKYKDEGYAAGREFNPAASLEEKSD